MIAQTLSLFRRYAVRHLDLAPPPPGEIAPGVTVEELAIRGPRLSITVAAEAEAVALALAGGRWPARPTGAGRFVIDAPALPGPARLCVARDGAETGHPLPLIPAGRVTRARLALLPGFVAVLVRCLPAILRWKRHGDTAARARVKRLLNLDGLTDVMPLRAEVLEPGPPAPAPGGPVVIVLPVFNALDLLKEALHRVAAHSDLPWQLVLVEDASTDPAVRPFLRDWAAGRENVTLIENAGNLGFVGSVNRGFAAAREGWPAAPVVLLNSDAFVPAGWLSRLVAPLSDPAIASVTPMSNAAELMSVPVICANGTLEPGEGDALDAAARRLNPAEGAAALPTGVGFCMALSPRFLAKLPGFDPVFGRGYGEETDWCNRARALGGRNIGLPNLFVEHRAGGSFTAPEKLARLRESAAVITKRYPGYDAEVQSLIQADPLLTPRLALGLAWAGGRAAGQGAALPVYLAHALGGGAESWLKDRIAEDIDRLGAAAVLRVGGPLRFQVELHSAAGMTGGATGEMALAERLLRLIPGRRMIYSCGVGDPDPVELPELMLRLGQGPGQGIEVLIHDYFPLSPAYTLRDSDGAFRGLPPEDSADPAHRVVRPDGRPVPLAEWRAAWGRLLAAAETVTVFSESSRTLVAAACPAARIALRPHPLRHAIPAIPPGGGRNGQPVIGVLGNIGPQKGAGLLVELSRRLAASGGAGLVILGDLDPEYALLPPAKVHGEYRLADIPGLVGRYGITCWLMPSLWPETFSFATHEVLATGLPVIAFDLGAQGDAVRAAAAETGQGGVVALRDGAPDWEALMALVAQSRPGGPGG